MKHDTRLGCRHLMVNFQNIRKQNFKNGSKLERVENRIVKRIMKCQVRKENSETGALARDKYFNTFRRQKC